MGPTLNCLTTFLQKVIKSWLSWPIFIGANFGGQESQEFLTFLTFSVIFFVEAWIFHPDDSKSSSQCRTLNCNHCCIGLTWSKKSRFLDFFTFFSIFLLKLGCYLVCIVISLWSWINNCKYLLWMDIKAVVLV